MSSKSLLRPARFLTHPCSHLRLYTIRLSTPIGPTIRPWLLQTPPCPPPSPLPRPRRVASLSTTPPPALPSGSSGSAASPALSHADKHEIHKPILPRKPPALPCPDAPSRSPSRPTPASSSASSSGLSPHMDTNTGNAVSQPEHHFTPSTNISLPSAALKVIERMLL